MAGAGVSGHSLGPGILVSRPRSQFRHTEFYAPSLRSRCARNDFIRTSCFRQTWQLWNHRVAGSILSPRPTFRECRCYGATLDWALILTAVLRRRASPPCGYSVAVRQAAATKCLDSRPSRPRSISTKIRAAALAVTSAIAFRDRYGAEANFVYFGTIPIS